MAECSSGNVNIAEVKICNICKKTLRNPLRLVCIHSYCKACLKDATKVEKHGKMGWNCQRCGMFSDERETKEDVLLQRLIAMEEEKNNVIQQEQTCEFCDEQKTDLLYCKDCRMVICDKCKHGHNKSPATKHHNMGKTAGIKEDIIDEVIFCTRHQSHFVETFCETCNELLCKMCLENHYEHVLRAVEQSLSKLVVDMDDCLKNITTKITITGRQVEAINEEMLNLQETYAKWRIDSDTKLEMLMKRLRATKALLDEQVNDEESRNLEILKEMKTKIQNQGERCKIVSVMAHITKMKTKHLSQMKELQSGLFKQANELKKLEIHVQSLQITTPYIDEKVYDYTDDEMFALLRPVKYNKAHKVMDQSGIKFGDNVAKNMGENLSATSGIKQVQIEENNKCEDLSQYLGQKFNNVITVTLPNVLCYRVSTMDASIYVGVPNVNTIVQYNTAGQLVHTYNNTHRTIVVKQACDDTVIAAGWDGLFVTNKQFNNWSLLLDGEYSDVVVHDDKFTTIDYSQHKVCTFHSSHNHGDMNKWTLTTSFDIGVQHRNNDNFNANTTLAVNSIDNSVIVCHDNTLVVYSNSGQHVTTITLPGYYRTVGTDQTGNVLLGEWKTGNIYSIKDVQQLDTNNMHRYLVGQKYMYIHDMAVDCDTNLWILHRQNQYIDGSYYLSRYVPMK